MTSPAVTRPLPRPRRPQGRAADAALACGVFLLVAVGSLRSLIGSRAEPWALTWLGWALIGAACAALYVRRRYPVAVASGVLAATAAYYLTSVYDGPLLIAFVVALYAVAAAGRLQAAVALAALVVIGTGVGTLAGNEEVNRVTLFMLAGWLVGVVALGWVRHNRLVLARAAEQRAASEERLRIARELHDVIGHHISLVNVQSAAALRKLRKNPDAGTEGAEAALGAIKEASRAALRELRTTLGVLRQVDEPAPTAPAPGLDRLGELAASARPAGVEVRLRTTGAPAGPLPAEVDLAAYRIAQEALTNVLRHAAATEVIVHLTHGAGQVTVEVTDNGRGPAGGVVPGGGITGMRERAHALGGELTCGPGPSGGFAVRARLPHRDRAAAGFVAGRTARS